MHPRQDFCTPSSFGAVIWFPPFVQLSSSFSSFSFFSSFSSLDSGWELKEKGDLKVPTPPSTCNTWSELLYSLGSCLLANRYLVVLCSGTVQSVIRFPHYRQVTKGAPVIKPRGVQWRLHNPISPRTPPPGCILPPGGIHSAPYPHFLLSESRKQGSRRHAAGRTSECLHLCTPDIAQTLSA